jgi:hypothetical protein
MAATVAALLATGMDLPGACCLVAEADPGGANAALGAFLKAGSPWDRLDLDAFAPWLTSLPDGLEIHGVFGCLRLANCQRLERLPAGLKVAGYLCLTDCVGLATLPDDLQAWGIELGQCRNLESLPEGFRVEGILDLGGCVRLRSLPAGLVAGSGLFLNQCVRLRSLPPGLQVGGDLDLRGCDLWDGVIPAEARISGDVVTDAYPKGRKLAEWRRLTAAPAGGEEGV